MQNVSVWFHAVFAAQFDGIGRKDGHEAEFLPDFINGMIQHFLACLFIKQHGLPVTGLDMAG